MLMNHQESYYPKVSKHLVTRIQCLNDKPAPRNQSEEPDSDDKNLNAYLDQGTRS